MRIAIEQEEARMDTSYNKYDTRILTLTALVELTGVNRQSILYYFETGQLPAVRIAIDPITKQPCLEPRKDEHDILTPHEVGMRLVQELHKKHETRQKILSTPVNHIEHASQFTPPEGKTYINIDEDFYVAVLRAAQEVKDEYMRNNPGKPPVVVRKLVKNKLGIGNNVVRYRSVMAILNLEEHLKEFPPEHLSQIARKSKPFDEINIIRGLNSTHPGKVPRSNPQFRPYQSRKANKED